MLKSSTHNCPLGATRLLQCPWRKTRESSTDRDGCSHVSLGPAKHFGIGPFPLPTPKSAHSGALKMKQLPNLQGRRGTLWYHTLVILQSNQYTSNTQNIIISLSASKTLIKERKMKERKINLQCIRNSSIWIFQVLLFFPPQNSTLGTTAFEVVKIPKHLYCF